MKNRIWKMFALLTLIFCFSVNGFGFVLSTEKAAEFTLKDQYNKEFTYKFPKDKITILAFADRDGSKQLEAWIRPLVEKYNGKIDIHGVASLGGVPSIAQGVVRRIMKNQVKYSVMLDWSGDVSRSYNYEKDHANIFLIDKQGRIISKEVGAANPARLENFFREINRLL